MYFLELIISNKTWYFKILKTAGLVRLEPKQESSVLKIANWIPLKLSSEACYSNWQRIYR